MKFSPTSNEDQIMMIEIIGQMFLGLVLVILFMAIIMGFFDG